MRKLIVITGPTATGKTAISAELAKNFGSEVISADSCQIYKGMDIGTAKATEQEMKGVPHHFIDIIDPDEEYSAALFQRQAFSIIDELCDNNRIPIVAGGTGLYVNSLVYELDFSNACKSDVIRQKYCGLADDKSVEYLYNILVLKDPDYAKIISKTDKRRIIRRLEILEQGGSREYDFRKKRKDYEIVIIGLKMNRELLYNRVNERVDEMMETGLLSEVQALYEKYGKTTSLKAIGYKEIIGYIDGEYDLEEAVRLIKRNTRRFAKRQLTWFKKDERIKWFDIIELGGIENTKRQIIGYIKEKGF